MSENKKNTGKKRKINPNLRRIEILVEKEDKNTWKEFGKKLGFNISTLIRLSVNTYIREYERSNSISANQDQLMKEKNQISTEKKEIAGLVKQLTEQLQKKGDKKEFLKDVDRFETPLKSLLVDHPEGLTHKKLANYLGIERDYLLDILKYYQEMSMIKQFKAKVYLK